MALIQRGNCTYLIHSVRRNGRVTSEYLGSGEIAVLEARLLALPRIRREEERRHWAAVEGALTVLSTLVEQVASETLIRVGYHRLPGRRTWRKWRGPYNMRKSRKQRPVPAPSRPSGVVPACDRPEDLVDVMGRAQRGDREAAKELASMLDADHDMTKVILNSAVGDLAAETEAALAGAIAGENLLAGELIKRRLRAQADELAGPDASPLEKLLARHVAACFVATHWAERRLWLSVAKTSYLPVEAHLHEFVDRAHRRLIGAAKLLATTRRLGLPSVLCVQAMKVELPPRSDAPNGSHSLPEPFREKEGDHE